MTSVVLAGGGTAGHTSPLIATAQALRELEPGITLTCVGTARGLETRVIPEAGLDLKLIPAVPLPRKASLELVKVPFRLLKAVRQAGRILANSHADVVIGFGGYVSLPAYLAARLKGVPIVIHEQNARPGLANRVAARFAKAVLTSFPATALPKAKFVGLPVRAAITQLANATDRDLRRRQARRQFALAPDLPVLLVSGGSQGARSINNATVAAIQPLLDDGMQVLHVWGPKNFHDGLLTRTSDKSGARYVPVAYVDDMAAAYAAADLMLARAGAGTVVETAMVGLPTILVPLPIGNGEQGLNAVPVTDAGAGVVVDDAGLDAQRLIQQVRDLRAKLASMSAAGRALMPAGAAQRVAQQVLDAAAGKLEAGQ